jgi:DNA polymerase
LDKVGAVLHLAVQKDKKGAAVMRQLTKPRNPTKRDARDRFLPEDEYEKFGQLFNYCADDVRSEKALDQRIPDLPPLEQKIWYLDQRINERGVCVDMEMVNNIQWAVEEYRVRLVRKCFSICGLKPSQTAAITEWIRAQLYPLPNLQAATVDLALEDLKEGPEYDVLHARRFTQMKAVSKFEAILRSICKDGRVHGMFLYHGAGTGRWSSTIVQLQNLFRGMKQVDPNEAIEVIRNGGLDAVIERWPRIDPMVVFGCCVRGMLMAAAGKQMMCNDYKAIEARIVAWLAGQEDILEVFREHGLIYEYTAAKMKGLDYNDVEGVLRPMKDKQPDLRFSGKTCLGPSTLVLTMGGWKPIVDVLKSDLLWDGEEWVAHAGVEHRGKRHSLTRWGLTATNDHKILLQDGSWAEWQQLAGQAEPELFLSALDSTGLSLLGGASTSPPMAGRGAGALWWSAIADRGGRLLRALSSRGLRPNATPAQRCRPTLNGSGSTATRCQRTNIEDAFSTGYLQRSIDVTARHPSTTTTTACAGFPSTRIGEKTGSSFSGMYGRLRGGMTRLWRWTEWTTTKGTSQGTFGSYRARKMREIREDSKTSKRKCDVYDVLSSGPRNRFTVLSSHGPVVVHNCTLAFGFQGGHNAYIRGAKQAGVDVDEGTATIAKIEWRAANPKIVDLWHDLEDAAKNAVLYPGSVFANKGTKKIAFKVVSDFLYMKLPSGRKLAYYKPIVDEDGLTYLGIDTFSRRWMRVRTYGGRLTENAVQATAADVLRQGMLNLEAAGYILIGTVHDEAMTEQDEDFGSLEEMKELMCRMKSWADGLPLDASGFIAKRYKK